MYYSIVTVIYNPNSTGPSESMARSFIAQLKRRLPEQEVHLKATHYAGHGEALAYSLAKETSKALIVSSSGDGGYHDIINGVMRARREGCDATAGLLPAGNANDHFHNLHDEDIIDLIADGRPKRIDLLTLKGVSNGTRIHRYGHSYIGFGLTPYVGKVLNKNKLNVFNQVWIVGKALLELRSIKLKIKGKVKRYDSVIFSNVDKMSKYLNISQPSRITDGKFEVTIFRRRDKLRLIMLLVKASVVGVKEDHRVRSFKLKMVDETSVQVDGEVLELDAMSKASIGIKKQTLPCIV